MVFGRCLNRCHHPPACRIERLVRLYADGRLNDVDTGFRRHDEIGAAAESIVWAVGITRQTDPMTEILRGDPYNVRIAHRAAHPNIRFEFYKEPIRSIDIGAMRQRPATGQAIASFDLGL